MYAIVDIAGQQFRVKKDLKVYVNRLNAAEGSIVEFDKVLLVDNEGKISVGTPSLDGYRVSARVLSHLKGDKVLVFKKKRRKSYQKMNGHRQYISQIEIKGILGKGETAKFEDEKPKAKKAAATQETTIENTATVKKSATKKTATKAAEKPKAEKKTTASAAKKSSTTKKK